MQFNRHFTFSEAADLVAYLRDLGITDCYASPIFTARRNSDHGYDVCNFEIVSPELGGSAGFSKFAQKLSEAGIGLLLDIVPNHMAADSANEWWRDVLEHGPASKYAAWFDIDWNSADPDLKGKVLLPILEDDPARLIKNRKLRLVRQNNQFWIKYYDRRLPLNPESRRTLSRQRTTDRVPRLEELLEQQHYRLAFWRDAARKLNYRRFFDVTDLICLRMESPQVFEATHKLVCSLMMSGKVTGLRVDHPDGLWNPRQYFTNLQFATSAKREAGRAAHSTHPLGVFVVAEKILTGDECLPQDWPVDGTTGYEFLNRLNGLFVDARAEKAFDEIYKKFTGNSEDFAHSIRSGKRKILSTSLQAELDRLARHFEELIEGQDFTLEAIRDALREVIVNFPVYRTYITEETIIPTQPERETINRAIAETLATRLDIDGELLRLIRSILLLSHPKSDAPQWRGFVMRFQQLSGPAMAKGLEDTAFYNYNRLISLNEVGGDPGTFGSSLAKFHAHNAHIALNWPHTLLATATHDTKRGEDARARINVLSEFPAEWQAALERWSRLNARKKTKLDGHSAPSANDEYLFYQTLVGVWANLDNAGRGTPSSPIARRAAERPFSAKLAGVEVPLSWGRGVRGEGELSTVELAHLKERLLPHMLKAAKEAKTHTSWLEPNPAYETALQNFVSSTLDPRRSSDFLNDFANFHRSIALFGYLNSTAQLLLKLTSPGVPDCYQGCELWDFSLVDPDNRRPVDFETRKKILHHLRSKMPLDRAALQGLLASPETGAVKMYVMQKALECRRSNADLFRFGNYLPLEASGQKADHIVAFARTYKKQSVIVITPRLMAGLARGGKQWPLGHVWADTVLSLGANSRTQQFRDLFTGEIVRAHKNELRLSEIFTTFPVVILLPEKRRES